MFSIKKKLKRGLTLIEAAMVLAISTLVVAGVMVFFQSASTNSKTNEVMSSVGMMAGEVRAMYASQPNYSGVNATALVRSNALPKKMINGNTIYHAFGGTVTIGAANFSGGRSNTFLIQLNAIPAEACAKLATMDMGRGVVGMRIGRRNVNAQTRINPSTAASYCGTTGNTTLRWQFQ